MGDAKRRQKRLQEAIKKSLSDTAEKMLNETAQLFQVNLTETDLKIWNKAIGRYKDEAVVWAFENWQRNGKFFPKPVEIMGLVYAYGASPENKFQTCGKCTDGYVLVNPEAKPCDYIFRRCECVETAIIEAKVPAHTCDDVCKRRHHRGYGEQDLKWLWKKRMASGRSWTEADYAAALDQLDRIRQDGAPGWRSELWGTI
jgi:hypothetical protein